MRLVTWNINSVRLRIDLVRQLSAVMAPDVLCLQETKVTDPLFPEQACRDMGYPHIARHGQKGYNGVAVLSKLPIEDIRTPFWCEREDCRHLVVVLAGGVEVHCLYVPAGGDIPDPETNPKFAHKLDFLREVAAWYAADYKPSDRLVVAGDFNVAPLDTDVWSHKQMLSVVTHTPVEVEALACLQRSLGWVDAVRHFVPPAERLYTWWSYRAADWAASDRGRRLDHVWVSPALAPGLRAALVARETRAWAPPSDHVPVMVDVEAG